MSITNDNSFCPRCGILTTENTNRLVTDSCGHQKCRRCLLADDECMECQQQTQFHIENNKLSNVSIDAAKAFPVGNITGVTNVRKKGRKIVSMPLHILRVQNGSEPSMHYYCNRCCKKFTSRSQQYYHLTCGSPAEKKYKCEQCDKAFSTRSHLNYHLETHTENIYNCKHCNKSFRNRIVLRKHEKHHYTASFKCTTCQKEFRSKYSLSAHSRKSHDDKELPFKCTECQKSYALKSTLKQHMQKHFDKKYACKYCDKRFQRNYTLKLHLKKHTKTDCFICGICFRKFSDAAVLLRHVKLHQDTVKYHCLECNVAIIRKDNMLRHIRTIHPGRTFESCVQISQPKSSNTKVMETKTSHEDITLFTEPKTVENSAVIKCIGKVEPMKVPTDIASNVPFVEANIMPTPSGCDTSTFMNVPTTLTTLQNVPADVESYAIGKSAVHKKVKKKYDPIKMYRKILATDCEDESVYDSDSEKEIDSVKPQIVVNTVTSVDMTPSLEKRATLTTSNFSEMHWRKNFKYTYEYQDF